MRPQHQPPARRRTGVVAAAAAVTLCLAGCVSAVDQAEEPEAEGATATRGGVLQMVQAADIQPATMLAQNNPNLSFARLVFNRLVSLDPETLEPRPELASAWTLADDGLTLTFTLRDDVTFHDGTPFTADDVIGTLETVRREEVASQLKHVANQIEDVVADGDHELTITFAQPMSNVFDLFELLPILDAETADDVLTGESFNGTGPFVVDEYTPGQGVTLTRNDAYWKDGRPYLDGVSITVVRDSQSMLSSLRSGQSQLALDLAPLDASTLGSDPAFELDTSPANDSTYYLGYNVTVPLLSDKRVRQAVAHAIDRERVLQQVFGGVGTISSLPWSPSSPAYDPSLVDTFSYDVERATELLEEAGATGAEVNVYYDAGFAANVGLAEIVEFNLSEAGLSPVMQPLQASDFLDRLRTGGFDGIFMSGHGFGQVSPATLVKGAFPYNADRNASSFDDAQYKELANAVWTAPQLDPATVDSLNAFLLDQQFVSDLVLYTHTAAISDDVADVGWTMFSYLDLDDAYLR